MKPAVDRLWHGRVSHCTVERRGEVKIEIQSGARSKRRVTIRGLTKDLGNCRLLSELFWKHRCTPQIAELFFGHPRLALTTAIIINIITPPSSSIWQLHFSRASIGSLWVKEHRAVLSESTHPLPWLFYYVVSEVNTRAFLLDNFPTLVLTLGSSTHFSAS